MDAAGAVFIRHWKNKRTCIEKENDVLDASIDEFTSATKNSMSALLYADKLSEEEFAALSKPEETHLRTKKVLYGYGSSKEMWMIEALSCGLFPFAIWMPFIKKSF